jgi:predicted negative regulator of RcsB-dependent stress response
MQGEQSEMTDFAGAKREADKALNSFTEALGLVDAEKDPGYYGVILHDIADAHVAAGNMREAAASYSEAMTYKLRSAAADPVDLAMTIESLADCLMACGDLEEARAALGKLRDILPQIPDPDEQAIHWHGVGRAYDRLASEGLDRSGSDALEAYEEAAQLLDRDRDPGFYGMVMHDIGDIQSSAGHLSDAIAAYNEAVTYKLKRMPAHPGDLTMTMLALADCLIETSELAEARRVLGEIAEEVPRIDDRDQRASRLHRLGTAYERLAASGRADAYADALAAFEDALKLIDQEADAATYATVLSDIGSVYRAQQRYPQARDAYEQAVYYMRKASAVDHELVPMLVDLGRIRLQIMSDAEADDGAGTWPPADSVSAADRPHGSTEQSS